jgi:hypothetical protein
VPPSAIARSVIPETEPPVIATALAFCVDIVPRPLTAVLAIAMLVFDAAVSRPCASTVKVGTADALPYDPALTAVLARLIVPVEVIGPPVNPVPVATLVTVPFSGAEMVIDPAPLVIEMPVPAVRLAFFQRLVAAS